VVLATDRRARRHALESDRVAERTHDELTDRGAGRVGGRIEEPERHPEGGTREPEHPAELASTEHRDEGTIGHAQILPLSVGGSVHSCPPQP
jgi:hypothetical protein